MNSKMSISVKSNINTVYAGVTVLLVDSDSTSLTIISRMLRSFGYKEITAKRASDALRIIRDREYKIDLILAEACLPDMHKYEVLETTRNMTRLPLILMSVDYDVKAMLGSLFKGAILHLVKPIIMDDLKNLWQFAFIKERENEPTVEEISSIEDASSMESTASGVDGKQNLRNEKRKRLYEDNADSATLKKPKLIWTNELHTKFLQAIKILGIEEAHPILQHMNVPGLKKVNVSSHLQKYRLSLKRQQDEIQKNMNRASHHVLSELYPQEGFHHISDMQTMSVAEQQGIVGLTRENLNGSMPIPSPVSSHLLEQSDSNYKQTQCDEQIDFAYPECYQNGTGWLVQMR